MNRYILIPEDTIRVLPPEDGAEAAIEIFCSRTVIYFEIAQMRDVCLMHNVLTKCGRADALCFTAADRLLEREQMVLVPTDRAIMRRFWPDSGHMRRKRGFFQRGRLYPGSCDHNGHHHG